MLQSRSSLASLAAIAAFAFAGTARSALPTTTGWYEIPNTKINSVCAALNGFTQVGGTSGCALITQGWSSGVLDTTRNRMILWGGGHNDYYGNELYAVNLNALTIQRITDPGLPVGSSSTCQEAIVGGTQPNSRHTYDGIEYIPGLDKMFVFGGSLACSVGTFGRDTWLFDFASNQWQKKNPTGTLPRAIPGILSAYDPNTGLVYVYDDRYFYSYDPVADKYTQLNSTQRYVGYHMTATVDPVRKKFLIIGWDNIQGAGKVWSVDIAPGSSYVLQEMVTTGGDALVRTAYPGVDYDSVSDRIVAWGQDTPNVVYSLNVSTRVWTAATYSGGPVPVGNGTMGRWRYSPALNAFALVNKTDSNVFVLRTAVGGGSAADTQAPSAPAGVAASAMSSSQVQLTWNAATDNVSVTSYRVLRCTGSGCTPSTTVASPTGISWADATVAAGTTYRYAVAAVDAAGNLSTQSAAVSVTPSATAAATASPTAEADFAARCGAAGVLKCMGFDNTTTDIVHNVTLWPDGTGAFRGGLDTSTLASGAGSLKFDLPPPPHAGANISGNWSPQNSPFFGRTFSENSTFYVQYRMRLSPEMITASFGNVSWKTSIFHYNKKTCGSIELTTSNYYGKPFGQMNTDCGGRKMWTTMDGSQPSDTPPMLMQQGEFTQCSYGTNYALNCMNFVANEWMTLYYKVHVGTWDQPNSTIEAWIAREGSTTYKQFIKVANFSLSCNGETCTTSPSKDEGYNNITLLPYMTGLATTTGPSGGARMWFDELIVSTQPIAAPHGTTVRPMPVGDFSVK